MDAELNLATRSFRSQKPVGVGESSLLLWGWLGFAIVACICVALTANTTVSHKKRRGKATREAKVQEAKNKVLPSASSSSSHPPYSANPRRSAPPLWVPHATQSVLRKDQGNAVQQPIHPSRCRPAATLDFPQFPPAFEHQSADCENEPRCTDHATWMQGADHGLTPKIFLLPASAVSAYVHSLIARDPRGCSLLQVPWSIPQGTNKLKVPLGKSPSLAGKEEMKPNGIQYLQELGVDCFDEDEWTDTSISCVRNQLSSPAYSKQHSLARHNRDELSAFLSLSKVS